MQIKQRKLARRRDGDDLPGASAAVSGGSNDENGRRGRTLTGKGLEPARQQQHARGRCQKARVDADGPGTRAGAMTMAHEGVLNGQGTRAGPATNNNGIT